jgi:hypothetical protein
MTIATKNAPKRIPCDSANLPICCNGESQHPSIPTEGVVAPRSPKADPQAHIGRHFTSKNTSSEIPYATAVEKRVLEPSASDNHYQKNTAQQVPEKIHWRRFCYTHHSPAEHDKSTESRHWRRQAYSHYETSLWTGYNEIRVTICPIRPCSTLRTSYPCLNRLPLGEDVTAWL